MELRVSKLSEQQEKFCRNIVEGMSASEAYREAGYKCTTDESTWAAASRLLGNVKVASRIAELRESATEGTEVTLQWLIEQAQGVLKDARDDSSHAAAISAIKELGVLTGERVEKRQNENINRDVADYSEEELEALIAGGGARAAGQEESETKPHKLH